MMRLRNAALALVLVILSLLALQNSPVSHSGSTTLSPSNVSIHLVGEVSGWNGTNPTITVTQGDMVSIILTSADTMHQFALDLDRDGAMFIGACPTGDTCSALINTGPGTTLTFTASFTPGTYVYFCTFHTTMVGSFVVRSPPPSLVAAVRGSDGNVYASTFLTSWSSWSSLSGTSLSNPAICSSGAGTVQLFVRGSDDGVYHKSFSGGTWSSSWDIPNGLTSDQPACAVLNGVLYLVVRGTNNVTWYNSKTLSPSSWSGWTSLKGSTPTAPVLVATPSLNRLDLIVRGIDNGTWHKSFTGGAWAQSWDNIGGITAGVPAVASDGTTLHVVVKGPDGSVWYNSMPFSSSAWSGWVSLQGTTSHNPALSIDPSGNVHLVVVGIDGSLWHLVKSVGGSWSTTWNYAGGVTMNSPGFAFSGTTGVALVQSVDGSVWFNTQTSSAWTGWLAMGGTITGDPQVASIV
jgi:plastocyanin